MPKKVEPISLYSSAENTKLFEPERFMSWDDYHALVLHNLRAIETRLQALERHE